MGKVRRLCPFVLAACFAGCGEDPGSTTLGQRGYDMHCARCHGIGGAGGEGPDLRRPLARAPDQEALIALIEDGIPERGMPETWFLSDVEKEELASYVLSLGRSEPAELPGDPENGRTVFEGVGCATCHMVKGQGSSLGPDLTAVGTRRGPQFLRDALLTPGDPEKSMARDEEGFLMHLLVRAEPREGEVVEGMRVNEDAFTIQIRDAANRFHSLRKAELKLPPEKKFGTSLMPGVENLLSDSQIEDLVAYLASLRGMP